jgi:hypothetical protein
VKGRLFLNLAAGFSRSRPREREAVRSKLKETKFGFPKWQPGADSFAAPRLIRLDETTTAFSRGYAPVPLRGWRNKPMNLHAQNVVQSGMKRSG